MSIPAPSAAEWPADVPPGPRAGLSQVVTIESLRPADSPRVRGQDAGHAHALRENLPDLPAILVNRRTMRVIDGMHRLSAARLAGAGTIRAEFIDTDERTAFLLAVRANTRRGLPLSLADREAAAERILSWYPYWSDRSIAAIAGRLVKDPALRYAEAGRVLVRWLDARATGVGDWRDVIDAIPSHWVETIINVAQSCGNEWHELAAALEQRTALACEE